MFSTISNFDRFVERAPYLKGYRLCFSLVYSSKIIEGDEKYTRLNKALKVRSIYNFVVTNREEL